MKNYKIQISIFGCNYCCKKSVTCSFHFIRQFFKRKDTEKKENSVSLRFYFSITTSNKCYNKIVAKL
jgi:hypothetical protein